MMMMSCKNDLVVDATASEATTEQQQQQQQRHRGGVVKHTDRMEVFPWITEFRAMSRLPTRPGSLIKLIRFFNKNVSSSVVDCQKKSSRAAKLKELIREALLLFMYFHRFEQPQDQNRAVYLEQMSDLLAVYVDLELIASKRQVEPQPSRISARLVSSLCLCLENSTEHLLDTLIKVQGVNESYCDILDPVISKVLKLTSPSPKSKLNGIAYVRYLLVYRLWKRLHINLAARKNIVGSALELLKFEPPSDLSTDILVERGILPSSQNSQSNKSPTQHYLCQSYDLRKACDQFIKYSRSQSVDETTTSNSSNNNNNNSSSSSSSSSSECSERDPRLKKSTLTSASSDSSSSATSSRSVNTALSSQPSNNNNINNNNSIINNKSVANIPKLKSNVESKSTTRTLSTATVKTKSKQLNEIVLIDLTDEEVTKIVKRKKRTRISWLDDAKRNFHTKIASLKIDDTTTATATTTSSGRSITSSLITEDNNSKQVDDTKQLDKEKKEEEEEKLENKKNSDASALSNGCSVIRETGRPAAVVTPKTDIEIPKVQEEVQKPKQQVEVTQPTEVAAATATAPPEVTQNNSSSSSSSNYYDGIDGLTLLASVSAQQMITTTTTSKKPELKVKPYTSLQQPSESIVEDTMDKVALQVEVCSSEPLPATKQDVVNYSYVLEEQATLEANDNANVILNGETVMLLQKSPNSNLYIINKAAVDSSKLNYNSDDEMMGMPELAEDIKPALKMEPGIEYPTVYPAHCMHQLSVDCACVSCAYCRPYFLPPPPPPSSLSTSTDKEKAFARFKDVDCKLPLKKRMKAQRMMDFAQTENHVPALELGAVVEVTTANKPRGRTSKKDKTINQNVPNCFPRKPGPKKKRCTAADDEVENNVLAPPTKKARRSSRRGLAAVSYADYEHEADCNPSGKRKKKRSTR